MGYFKKQLETFKKTDLRIWEVLCATEVECLFDAHEIELTDSQFECVVNFVYDWVMGSEISPNELVQYILIGLEKKDFSLFDFIDGNWNDITDKIDAMI